MCAIEEWTTNTGAPAHAHVQIEQYETNGKQIICFHSGRNRPSDQQ